MAGHACNEAFVVQQSTSKIQHSIACMARLLDTGLVLMQMVKY